MPLDAAGNFLLLAAAHCEGEVGSKSFRSSPHRCISPKIPCFQQTASSTTIPPPLHEVHAVAERKTEHAREGDHSALHFGVGPAYATR